MSLVKMKFPPGVYRPGTKYDAAGRWYDTNLVRWKDGQMRPWGGWAHLCDVGDASGTASPVRGMLAVSAFASYPATLYFGTATQLFVRYGTAFVNNVTPSQGGTLTTGAVDASGYPWSEVEAATWALDTIRDDDDEYVLAMLTADGKLWRQAAGSGVSVAFALCTNAPTGSKSFVVTPERFVMLLGAQGIRNRVQWSDQAAFLTADDWDVASTTNQAGYIDIPTPGKLMCGLRGRDETLIWSDMDLHAARYIGGDYIYSIPKVGDNCGIVSRKAAAVVNGKALWMGTNGFFAYDGFVEAIPCEVGDYVFSDINLAQKSKIAADVRSDFHEVIWYYPSASSTENDRYVAFNYLHGFWMIGSIARTSGVDRGPLAYPVAADPNGNVYSHEVGTTYTDTGGTAQVPTAESGPMELGNGDNVMMVRQYIPDEKTLGDVSLQLIYSMYPNATETTSAAITAANPGDVRLTARQIRLKLTQASPGWRWGTPRLEVEPGGLR